MTGDLRDDAGREGVGASRRPTREEQIGGRCKHFTGTVKEHCRAGVCYDDVELTHEPIEYRGDGGGVYHSTKSLPCIRRHNHIGAVCDKIEFPTSEEVAAQVIKERASFNRIRAAREAIVTAIGPYKKGKSRDVWGTIVCPNCGGRLHYRRSAYNGHIHANCSTTSDCATWME